MNIEELIPHPEDLLRLKPEELAGVLLKILPDRTDFKRGNLFDSVLTLAGGYPHEHLPTVLEALTEAWVWLEREGLIAPSPEKQDRDWCYITRRGMRLRDSGDIQTYRKASILPKELLHPVIIQKVYSAFLRGEYVTAVFQAFREVEVAVRAAAGFGPEALGIPMMRNAFQPVKGPLADLATEKGEQEAVMHLFSGAIGYCKNPMSHHSVPLSAEESVELLMLASHLLRIVDSRVAKNWAASV